MLLVIGRGIYFYLTVLIIQHCILRNKNADNKVKRTKFVHS